MLTSIARSETAEQPGPRDRETWLTNDRFADFIPALFSGGDSRVAIDAHTGLNKYFCPNMPAPDVLSASSCTATPVSVQGFCNAADTFAQFRFVSSPRQRADRIRALTGRIEARLLDYFGAGSLARALLCPSGTDALLSAAVLLSADRPEQAITAILPSAAETGTGVRLAAVGCLFDGADSGRSLTGCTGSVVEIPLRLADGSPRCEDAVNHDFAAASRTAAGHVIIYLTHGTKTGLIAPTCPLEGVDVIVDACQSRIEPKTVQAYLRRGWPVAVTGSKFFGGPAFSGAVLFPAARLPAHFSRVLPAASAAARLGTALRWTAALPAFDAFKPVASGMVRRLSGMGAAVEQALASTPALFPIDGLQSRAGSGWADLPSIFTFAVRDPMDHRRLLSAAELRPLYDRLARGGVLLGQPVTLGQFGGLRIAIGARDLLDPLADEKLARVLSALEAATAS